MGGQITSLNNTRIRRVQALQRSTRRRYREGLIVAEGTRLVQEALHSSLPMEELFYTQAFVESEVGETLVQQASLGAASVWEVSPEVMAALSDTLTPQGILAVLALPQLHLGSSPNFILLLDSLRDPGNMGTILRTAWAAGVQQVIIAPGTVDPFNPKAVRAGMGAHFFLPISQIDWVDIYKQVTGTVCLAEMGRGTVYDQVDWSPPVTLVVGGEASGASSQGRALAGENLVYIPMCAGVDSLNVAMATGILLFEISRQRRHL